MSRIDEKVFVAGNMKDEDGKDVYVDLSDFLVLTANKYGNPGDRLIPYADYYNVEAPKEKRTEETKSPYDPNKVYLNHGHSILTISVEMLEELGKPSYFNLVRNRKNGDLLIVFTDEVDKDGFDIPKKVYNGKWKGIHVYGGEYGHALCAEMGVRHTLDLLETAPEIDADHKMFKIRLDEIKRSNAEIVYTEFLLPQWQYEELWEDD